MMVKESHSVIVEEYPDAQKINNALATFIKSFKGKQRNNSNVRIKNYTPWKIDSYETYLISNWTKNLIKSHFGKWLDECQFNLLDCFGNVYEHGGSAGSHDHIPCTYSFVYFVETPPKSAPLIFSSSKTKIAAKAGRICIFPSNLRHEVPISKHKGTRIVLAGNYEVHK